MTRLSNRDVDDLIESQYEDALAAGEPWAVEAFEYRKLATSTVDQQPEKDDAEDPEQDPVGH